MGMGLILGLAGAGAVGLTVADRYYDVFGLNPLKDKWWWERIAQPTNALTRPGAKLTKQEWESARERERYSLERRMLQADLARKKRIVDASVKYRVTG